MCRCDFKVVHQFRERKSWLLQEAPSNICRGLLQRRAGFFSQREAQFWVLGSHKFQRTRNTSYHCFFHPAFWFP